MASSKPGSNSSDRDHELAKANQEKVHSHIVAWEENEKAKALNKYQREISEIQAHENLKKSNAEIKLKKKEDGLDKKRATYVEKIKNEIAKIHMDANEKRALAEAKKKEELVSIEEKSAKFKALGNIPKKLSCFGA